MRQKWTIFALAALLVVGMTGCGSGSNRTTDESWPNTYAVQPNGETGNYNGGNGTIGGNGAQRDGGNSAVDGYGGTGGTNTNGNNGTTGNNGGILGDLGDGIDDAMDSVGNGIGDVMNGVGDTLTGNNGNGSSRYQDMLENGRVHDSDGYLMDGENRHD